MRLLLSGRRQHRPGHQPYPGRGGTVYASGNTNSSDFPVSTQAFDSTYASSTDIFLSRITLTGLWTNTLTLSAASGGTVDFSITAGTDHTNRSYLLLGSVSGTEPGIPLSGGGHLPLVWDVFTSIVASALNTPTFSSFFGGLNLWRNGTAQLNAPLPLNPGLIGTSLYFAYALNQPWNFASNPVEIEIIP